MTFPPAGAEIYRNEAGEVTGWDNPAYDDGPDPDKYYEQVGQYDEPDDEDEEDRQPSITKGSANDFVVRLPAPHGYLGSYPTLEQAQAALDEATGRDDDEPEPNEPDSDEVSWQEHGRDEAAQVQAEAYGEMLMARYDDDPSPYDGTYSEE